MAGFAYYVIKRNDTINDSIFHISNGMQEAYSKVHKKGHYFLDTLYVTKYLHSTTGLVLIWLQCLRDRRQGTCRNRRGWPAGTWITRSNLLLLFYLICRKWKLGTPFFIFIKFWVGNFPEMSVKGLTPSIVAIGHGLLEKFWPLTSHVFKNEFLLPHKTQTPC